MTPKFESKAPNKITVKAMQDADKGKEKKFHSAMALFKHLNI
jgi:hypothetical protein